MIALHIRRWKFLFLPAALSTLTGCSHSPSFNILGSYFPSWIVCVVAGSLVTAAVHAVISRTRLVEEIWPLAVVYPALIVLVSCTIWWIFFS